MDGHGALTVSARNAAPQGEDADGFVMIAVSDTGDGMDAQTQERVFEPFFTTKEPGRGTGLGLAVVYGTIKQHGGFLTVDSEPGRGATFVIHLPVSDRATTAATAAPRAGTGAGGLETILVAEDDAMVLTAVRRILQKAGYTVLTASDGAEACAMVEQDPGCCDLALLDMIMPRMGGREAAERIAAAAPGTRILFSSGYNEEVFEEGDDDRDLLRKPYNARELLGRLRVALDRA
jgi:CheY-like chemotaxis protein